MHIRDAREPDLEGILAIYNDAVLTTTAIWNETPADLDNRRAWLAARAAQGYPVFVAAQKDAVVGYASFGDFRAWDGYRHTVEHSVYVQRGRRGEGIGALLLSALIAKAGALGKHVMIAGIEASNAPSIRLHAKMAFVETGRLLEVGRKFDRWLDLVLMQRVLTRQPVSNPASSPAPIP